MIEILAEIGWVGVAVAAAAVFFGVMVFSATGFGIGMIATPLLLLAFEPQTAIIVPGVMGFCVGLRILGLHTYATWGSDGASVGVRILAQSWRDIPFRDALPISAAAVVGSPVGVLILRTADAGALSIGIAALIILFAIGSFFKVERELPYSRALGILAGFVVGVLLPTTGVAGSLVMLYLMTKNWERQRVRAAMAFFLMTLMVFALSQMALAGLFTETRLALIGATAIPGVVGAVAGTLLASRLNDRLFQYMVIGIIIVSSVAVIGREVVGM